MEGTLENGQIILILPDGAEQHIIYQDPANVGTPDSDAMDDSGHMEALTPEEIDQLNNQINSNKLDENIFENTVPKKRKILKKQITDLPHNQIGSASDDGNISSDNNKKKTQSGQSRFQWTKEKSDVALNMVKHGCKPKLISIAFGCSLRTAQKFVETVTPKMKGGEFKEYVIKQRGRHKKNVNSRLEAIKQAINHGGKRTQVEIAADLNVSNTTVCRDLKKISSKEVDKKNLIVRRPRKNKPNKKATTAKAKTTATTKSRVKAKSSPTKLATKPTRAKAKTVEVQETRKTVPFTTKSGRKTRLQVLDDDGEEEKIYQSPQQQGEPIGMQTS